MYLSLAAVAALAVLGPYTLIHRWEPALSASGTIRRPLAERLALAAAIVLVGALSLLTLRRNEDYKSGVAMWSGVVASWPASARAHANLGLFLAKQGNVDQALQEFASALQVAPDDADAHENMGMALVQQGKLDDAIEHLRKAVELDPARCDTYTKLGAALANEKRMDEAVAAFSKALAIAPDYGPALANMGFAEQRQGKTEDAIAFFSRALRHLANNELAARIHFSLGELMEGKGDMREAAIHYREALRLKPDFVPAQQRIRQIVN